ncbi:MAG: peptide chain release factor N(5)-glutamine methyltransferase [Abditibacteriaceae bacterium]
MLIETAYHDAVRQLQEKYSSQTEAAAAVRLVLDHLMDIEYVHLKFPEKILSPQQLECYQSCLKRLLEGHPAPYVVGKREFYGHSFICDERALIPRPESETLVELAISHFKDHGKVLLADLGCGSGCIGISVARELPGAQFIATDISAEALKLARENAIALGVDNQFQFVQGAAGDWTGPLGKVLLDGILTNPPYIPNVQRPHLQPSVRDFEPDVALFGGGQGMDEHRHLARQCRTALKPEGHLWSEIGDGQFDQVRPIYEEVGWKVFPAIDDFAGIERVLHARL